MKKDFAKLYDYFRSLSGGSNQIDIVTFNRAFKGKEYMERVTSGLFNFLDKDNTGYVTFDQFLKIYFPQINKEEIPAIMKWVAVNFTHR
jgi:Ca2+-binding EF-hand superfamily protein